MEPDGSMTAERAEELILAEALGEEGIVVQARMGDDPGPERMAAVTQAVATLFQALQGATVIDRRLAYALFLLAHETDVQLSAWIGKGRKFRDTLFDPEVLQLASAVDSVFSGEWAPFMEGEQPGCNGSLL